MLHYIYKEIHYKVLAHATMEAERPHDLPPAGTQET